MPVKIEKAEIVEARSKLRPAREKAPILTRQELKDKQKARSEILNQKLLTRFGG